MKTSAKYFALAEVDVSRRIGRAGEKILSDEQLDTLKKIS